MGYQVLVRSTANHYLDALLVLQGALYVQLLGLLVRLVCLDILYLVVHAYFVQMLIVIIVLILSQSANNATQVTAYIMSHVIYVQVIV
jgi:hypothetical protein